MLEARAQTSVVPNMGPEELSGLLPNGQGSLEPAQPVVLECPPSRTLCLRVTRGTQAFHRAWPAVCCVCAQYRVRDTGNVINHRPMSFTFTTVACASCSRKGCSCQSRAALSFGSRKPMKLLDGGTAYSSICCWILFENLLCQ